jgi:Zn-dependent protease
VIEITLWLFGGVAKLEGDADDAGAEFRIAAAGPAMSMVMAGLFAGGFWLVDRWDGSQVLIALLVWFALINVVLAVSNLLPAFPLDGGRMLRAFLWRRSSRKMVATRTASLWGQILAGVLIAGSLARCAGGRSGPASGSCCWRCSCCSQRARSGAALQLARS